MNIQNFIRQAQAMNRLFPDGQNLNWDRIDLTVKTITSEEGGSVLNTMTIAGLLTATAGVLSGSAGNFTTGSAGDFVEGVLGDYYPDDGTATASSNAATLAKNAGKITTEALSTAGLAEQVITVTDTRCAAADIITASLQAVSGSGGTPALGLVTPAAGSWTATIHNLHATTGFTSRVFAINFRIHKA